MKYRPEIDGLRALAVIPVILIHAGFTFFSGGFIGVDIFFVISGYLITTILIEKIKDNNFSIISFYKKRARRIIPALFFVMLVCIPFAWMWMMPSELKKFSLSIVSVIFFLSNILFWKSSNYFDNTSEEIPLLHTWSLSIEEQFYILFPIFLLMAWKFFRNKLFILIIIGFIVSLTLSEYGYRNYENANFYLAPTRAWELLVGSISALLMLNRTIKPNNIYALVGLTLIIFSVLQFDENTPVPSIYILVPVTGTSLLILFAHKDTWVARLLSTNLFVGLGLISYSAYLWHQPIFAFARIRGFDETNYNLMTLLTVSSFVLAWFSWRFVESPFRKIGFLSTKSITYFFLISLMTLLLFGSFGYINDGFQNRIPNKLKVFTSKHRDGEINCHDSQTVCFIEKKKYKKKDASIWR